jgi:hypothetical protein
MRSLLVKMVLLTTVFSAACARQPGPNPTPGQRPTQGGERFRSVRTRIFRVHTPTNQLSFFQVYSTSDATVYLLDRNQVQLAEQLESASQQNEVVELQLEDRDILSARVLSASDARNYRDQFSSAPEPGSQALVSRLEGEETIPPQPSITPTPSEEGQTAPTSVDAVSTPVPAAPDAPLTSDTSSNTLSPPLAVALQPVAPPTETLETESTHGGSSPALPSSLLAARAEGYEPTILASDFAVRQAFDTMPRLRSDSQCFQRAHIWSFELYRYSRINTMKAFMIFTTRFQEEFCKYESWENIFGHQTRCTPYKWWFHVAPFVYTRNGSQIQETVLDPEFLREPKSMRDWSYHFVGLDAEGPAYRTRGARLSRADANCPEIPRLRHQRARNGGISDLDRTDAYCFIRKVPAYLYQPVQIEDHDLGLPAAQIREWTIDPDYHRPCRLNWPLRDAYSDANPSGRANFCRPD